MEAIIMLEDGYTLEGRAFAGRGTITGEAVFNTSLTGYQEIITDPSYQGQILTLTAPMIGNCGVNPRDLESSRPALKGLIVREYSPAWSNWRGREPLHSFLEGHGVVAVEQIDTRALTRHLRSHGSMQAVLTTEPRAAGLCLPDHFSQPGQGDSLVQQVTCPKSFSWNESGQLHVVALDFGAKASILRQLQSHDARVTVVPAQTSAREILNLCPDGVFLSNGPGDPADVDHACGQVAELLGRLPIFGICLGHQVLARALGLETFKLKFGHRGGNHPVRNLDTGSVEITTQNHGYCVEEPAASNKRIPASLRVTHRSLTDGTVEGLACPELGVFSVQYHPEASPGPHDSRRLFLNFENMMRQGWSQVKKHA